MSSSTAVCRHETPRRGCNTRQVSEERGAGSDESSQETRITVSVRRSQVLRQRDWLEGLQRVLHAAARITATTQSHPD